MNYRFFWNHKGRTGEAMRDSAIERKEKKR